MSNYLMGDIHGCYDELKIILARIKFNSKVDTLWLTGDLVARGPNSLEVLRLVRSLGNSVRLVLGNHDLYLLTVYAAGIGFDKIEDSIIPLLKAPDADELINWLRCQPLLQVDRDKKLIMSHAGITPQWDLTTALQCAREIESVLQSNRYPLFLDAIFGNVPNNWSPTLGKLARLRFSTNVFTRMRYCLSNGQLEMNYKGIPEKAPALLKPWYTIPGPVYKYYNIIFGHWASLMGHRTPKHIYGLDTGCCWGGALTVLCWENKIFTRVPSTYCHDTSV